MTVAKGLSEVEVAAIVRHERMYPGCASVGPKIEALAASHTALAERLTAAHELGEGFVKQCRQLTADLAQAQADWIEAKRVGNGYCEALVREKQQNERLRAALEGAHRAFENRSPFPLDMVKAALTETAVTERGGYSSSEQQ